MSSQFEPEPRYPIRCHGDGCGHSIVAYHPSRTNLIGQVFCPACAEVEWNKRLATHKALMAADRAALGDETFVKIALPDASLALSKTLGRAGSYYIMTWKSEVTAVTGVSGYAETPGEAWKQMADKIDRSLREPYR